MSRKKDRIFFQFVVIKHFCIVSFIMICIACNQKPETKSNSAKVERASSKIILNKAGSTDLKTDTSKHFFQKVLVDGESYTAYYTINKRLGEQGGFFIKKGLDQIVFSTKNIVIGAEFKDFDGDGYKDILLERRGVDSGQQDLLLYDPKTKKYILVGNCTNAERIKDTKYYYSYEDCCMGRFFSSDLFFISNFKIIRVGFIKYDDSIDGSKFYGLRIYRINGGTETLMQKLKGHINGNSAIATGRHIDFELGEFWAKNYTRFIDE